MLPDRRQALEELFAVFLPHEQLARVAAASGEVVDAFVEIPRAPGHQSKLGGPPSPDGGAITFGTLTTQFCDGLRLTKPSVGHLA